MYNLYLSLILYTKKHLTNIAGVMKEREIEELNVSTMSHKTIKKR